MILVKNIRARAFFRTTGQIAFTSAKDLDIYGNYAYRELWNAIFKKSNSIVHFGRKGETISSVLGRLQRIEDLSWMGWIIVWILYAIDYKYWGKGGHCLNSIMRDQEILDWFDSNYNFLNT